MPIGVTTYTTSDRLPLMPPGTNTDTWGTVLNGALQRLEDMKDGVLSFNLSGSKTLISANDTTDEAHNAVMNVTGGSGGTITFPAVAKVYLVRIDPSVSGNVTLSAGGKTVTCYPGEVTVAFFTGVDCFRPYSFHAAPAPQAPGDVATKAYVDNAALTAAQGSLPGQTGNSGYFLQTNGSTASWQPITESEVQGAKAFSIAMALSL